MKRLEGITVSISQDSRGWKWLVLMPAECFKGDLLPPIDRYQGWQGGNLGKSKYGGRARSYRAAHKQASNFVAGWFHTCLSHELNQASPCKAEVVL